MRGMPPRIIPAPCTAMPRSSQGRNQRGPFDQCHVKTKTVVYSCLTSMVCLKDLKDLLQNIFLSYAFAGSSKNLKDLQVLQGFSAEPVPVSAYIGSSKTQRT